MSQLIVPGGRPAPAPEAKGPAEPIECVTAFVIYQLPNGQVMATDDLNIPLQPVRRPVNDELWMMSGIVQRDAAILDTANLTANTTIGTQINMGRQAAEQRQAQMLQQQLEADADKVRRGSR